jgi:hypothetical protein
MKAIFYVGTALMIGASIYGFVDYKKTIRTEGFRKMYEEKKEGPVIPTPAVETKLVSPEKIAAKETQPADKGKKAVSSALTKKVKAPKKLSYKEFSRAPLREEPEVVKPAKSNRKL